MKVSKGQIKSLVEALSVIGSICLICLAFSATTRAQSTAFSYQGNLEDGGTPATGNYDFEFRLFDQLSGGTQLGPVVSANGINVSDGAFTVTLDFGSEFPGGDRWIELRVKQASSAEAPELGGFTILTPRQKIGTVPYAVRSTSAGSANTASTADNALQLGGVPASNYVVTTDPRLTDSRTPTAGSSDYIQNSSTQQAASDFNISGTGRALVFDSTDGYQIAGSRILGIGVESTFAGVGAGNSVSAGGNNSFFGYFAGNATTNGLDNSFFGRRSGRQTTTGSKNSFFGRDSGSFNTIGAENSFFGEESGYFNNSGSNNSFFGGDAGYFNTTGSNNSIYGWKAGLANTTGSGVTLIGAMTNVAAADLVFATAIGSGAVVATSNTIQLGRADGSDKVNISGNLDVTGAIVSTTDNVIRLGLQGSDIVSIAGDLDIGGPINANIVNGNTFNLAASGGYLINGVRVLSVPGDVSNLAVGRGTPGAGTNSVQGTFVGTNAGNLVSTGNANSFFGYSAGKSTTTGVNNTFIGSESGVSNSSGDGNTFIGRQSGKDNADGFNNTFVGDFAGGSNTDGGRNTVVGAGAGRFSDSFNNSFFGYFAGGNNTTGSRNTFIGESAGCTNTTGSFNIALGAYAGCETFAPNLQFATVIGAEAKVFTSNTIVLGRPAGEDRVSMAGKVTIGSDATNYGQFNINAPSTNANFYMSGDGETKGINFGVDSTTAADAKLFISQYDGTTYKDRVVINEFGVVSIAVLGLAGSTSVCRNASLQLATCSSSMRYKDNVENFSSGMDLIKRLRPVSFNWKDGGMLDLGLVAEEVAAVEPLLTTINPNGEVEGVKYDRVGVVLINVVNEQQAKLEMQNKKLEIQKKMFKEQADELSALKAEVAALKALVCAGNPEAEICGRP